MSARHTIETPEGEEPRVVMRRSMMLPYQKWFNVQDYEILGSLKGSFFSDMAAIELSPAFEDFRSWLDELQCCFSIGFNLKVGERLRKLPVAGWITRPIEPTLVPFDDETLGGYVDYPAIVEPARRLGGELKGLVIRYNITPSPPSTPTGAVQADA